jgi:hypothetical protein
MRHARRLIESRPVLDRVPDQGLLVSEAGSGAGHVRATRASDGSYAFVYVPTGEPVTVDLGKLAGKAVTASWYDPRTGEGHRIGERPATGTAAFEAPSRGEGHDWVLVLDDAGREFAPLGTGGPSTSPMPATPSG